LVAVVVEHPITLMAIVAVLLFLTALLPLVVEEEWQFLILLVAQSIKAAQVVAVVDHQAQVHIVLEALEIPLHKAHLKVQTEVLVTHSQTVAVVAVVAVVEQALAMVLAVAMRAVQVPLEPPVVLRELVLDMQVVAVVAEALAIMVAQVATAAAVLAVKETMLLPVQGMELLILAVVAVAIMQMGQVLVAQVAQVL
jgi:hypothetical protein